jgi:hypothetical protein
LGSNITTAFRKENKTATSRTSRDDGCDGQNLQSITKGEAREQKIDGRQQKEAVGRRQRQEAGAVHLSFYIFQFYLPFRSEIESLHSIQESSPALVSKMTNGKWKMINELLLPPAPVSC